MSKLNIQIKQVIELRDWDKLVKEIYKRPYSFQQQDGCRERGSYYLEVPAEAGDFENATVKEIVNGPETGVSFNAWLARDPKLPLTDPGENSRKDQWSIDLWWFRNFYPSIEMVANDLHAKGLLPAGKYTINIDW